MKLYLYDHCPFCVRAAMTAHYKRINVETLFLLNDDEETCFRLVNAKQVPILEFDDGSATPESLDIAHKFDEQGDTLKEIKPLSVLAKIVTTEFSLVQKSTNCLLQPRVIEIGLPEFATQSAIDYFVRKKEAVIGKSFSQALRETPQHKTMIENVLNKLPKITARPDGAISWDDILIFPTLRNLTIVKDINFPLELRKYIDEIAARTAISLYFDRAL